jgi:5'(3')-deoxyribonucleotidase
MKVKIKEGTSVLITPESRALLERAHKDGIVNLYVGTIKHPNYDSDFSCFEYNIDITVEDGYSFSRTLTVSHDLVVTVEQLEKMLYPIKHNLVEGDAVVVTRGSHAVVRELAKKYNVPLFSSMETDSFEDETNWGSEHYKFTGKQIIRNSTNINVLSLDEFALKMMGLGKPISYKVKLNDNHEAVVTKDSIKVGCQTFPHSVVEELKAAIEKLK